VRDGDEVESPDVLDEGFLMRFRARLPLRARGCAIATTELRRSPRDFRVREGPVYPDKNLLRRESCEGAGGRGAGGAGKDGGEQTAKKILARG